MSLNWEPDRPINGQSQPLTVIDYIFAITVIGILTMVSCIAWEKIFS